VAEIDQDAANVAALRALLKSGANLRAQLDEDVERGTVTWFASWPGPTACNAPATI